MRFVNEKEVLQMAKKLKKAKKGMNPKVKFTLVNSFKGLISNQAVIDGSKDSPWWVAVIFLVFSSFLPLIPTFAQLSKMDGASFLNTYNYGLDENLAHFAYSQYVDGYEYRIESGKLMSYTGTTKDVNQRFVDPQKDATYFIDRKCEYSYTNTINNQFEVKVYLWVDENLKENVDKVVNQKYLIKGADSDGKTPATGADGEKPYLPNIVIFTPSTMAVALYKEDTDKNAGATYGGLDWLTTSTEKGLIERIIGEEGIKYLQDNPTTTETTFVNKFKENVLKNFRTICTETYLNQKNRTKWSNTGIYLAIYAGVILFLGLMVFILTRGKNNPYKFLNIWECQKISWWGAASPAIIGTLLSLIFSGNAIGQMAFILVVSLRIMWLSMKQLRPVIQ